jgi:hypothetical protein
VWQVFGGMPFPYRRPRSAPFPARFGVQEEDGEGCAAEATVQPSRRR